MEEYLDADFCFTRPGKIGDLVFCDDNRNGQLDPGEHGIEGVTVNLECKDSQGTVFYFASTTTDVDGKYCFENLDPGLCKVTVDPFAVPGKTPTCPTEVTVNLDQGEIYLDADFCYGPDCLLDLAAFCFVPLPPASGNDDCGDDKVKAITMVYTADDCNATSSNQKSDKVSCEDFGALPDTAFIIVTDEDKPSDALAGKGKTYFRGTVSKDDAFAATAANAGEEKFRSETHVFVFTSEAAGLSGLRQAVEFHTSCSQPLAVGNQFGANLIVELNFDNGRVVTLPDPSGPTLEKNCVITRTSGEICPSGDDIFALELLYTAEDCNATSSSQKSDKVSCEDFGALPDNAFIIVTDEDKVSDALDGKGKTYFRGNVSKNSVFSATAANAGEDKFSGETHVFVFTSEAAGESGLRQQIEFHTSCSQPINTGDQFGSIAIFGGDTKEGQVSQGSTVTFVYEVTNTAPAGGAPLTGVMVSDAYGTVPGSPIASIAPGEVVVLERTVTVSSQVVNTVVATGQPAPCEDVDAVTISVVDPPPPPKKCESGIQAMLLSYRGADLVGPVTVIIEPSKGKSVEYDLPGGLANGAMLSSGGQGGWTIDALADPNGEDSLGSKVFILINGTDLDGGIHTSCSAPFVQGQPAPLNDPKGDPSPTWFVEDFRDKD